jgi:AraC family transcriptional regulator
MGFGIHRSRRVGGGGFGHRLARSGHLHQYQRFLRAAVLELARLNDLDGGLDPFYCDVMSRSLASYLLRRYAGKPVIETRACALPRWKLGRICDYIDANLHSELRISDLALMVGITPSYFHRAFRITTGQTPLAFINERRVQRAMSCSRKTTLPFPRPACVSDLSAPRISRAFSAMRRE